MDKLVGKTFTASVLGSDIVQGCEKDAENCPIARSIQRLVHQEFGYRYDGNMKVTQHKIRFMLMVNSSVHFSFKPSIELSRWMIDFDRGNDVQPINVNLNITHNFNSVEHDCVLFRGNATLV